MVTGPSLHKRPVEEVAVVSDDYIWPLLLKVVKEMTQKRNLGRGDHMTPYDVIINDVMITSSGSLVTVKGPSYSGFGVYSKSSTSAPTTSRLVIRYPWQQI